MTTEQDSTGLVSRGQLEQAIADLTKKLVSGQITLPAPPSTQSNFAGAVNHAPNSDSSYSKLAAMIEGTLPGDAGDENQEDHRYFRQIQGDNVTVDAAHAVKAVDHSLYAADEGVNLEVPIWDRENGWVVIGGESGSDQYDICLQLLSKLVGPGQHWFFLVRIGCLTDDVVDPDVEFYAGVWQKGVSEGWATGDPFVITYSVHGTVGTKHLKYKVLAKTDSGVSILSAELDVTDAPDVLSEDDYVQLFFNAGPGFLWFDIYREDVVAGTFALVFTIRNSTDLLYNDIGAEGQPKPDWPVDPGDAPLAYAKTRTLAIGAFGGTWKLNTLTIAIPSTYNFANTDADGQFLRFGFTAPSTVNRQLGIDRIMFSTQYGEWAPDVLPSFADGTYPVPSISPTSSSQGGNGGLIEPPDPGGGGGLCILADMPVMISEPRGIGRFRPARFKKFSGVKMNDRIKGQHRAGYQILQKREGTASQYYELVTANGIRYCCNARHELIRDVETRSTIQAQQIVAGETRIAGRTLSGRRFKTIVVSKKLIPRPAAVGTFSLRHPERLSPDGKGMYIAGWSRNSDKGLFSSNVKQELEAA